MDEENSQLRQCYKCDHVWKPRFVELTVACPKCAGERIGPLRPQRGAPGGLVRVLMLVVGVVVMVIVTTGAAMAGQVVRGDLPAFSASKRPHRPPPRGMWSSRTGA